MIKLILLLALASLLSSCGNKRGYEIHVYVNEDFTEVCGHVVVDGVEHAMIFDLEDCHE